jgi:hypothetical protein
MPTNSTPDPTAEQKYTCQECGRLTDGKEYHPYWHCVLQKAGQLDFALKAITERQPTPAPSQDSSADAALRTQVHRLIIENRGESGFIGATDQIDMAEDIIKLIAQKVREALETERTATLGLSNDMKIKRSLYLAEENGYKRCMEDMKRKAQLTPPSAESETVA